MSNHHIIGPETWLLNEIKGVTIWDQLVLNSLKYTYLGVRALLRLLLGTEKRNRLFKENKITYSDFLYKSVELLHLDGSLLIVFDSPNYDYKFCSKVTRRVKNYLIQDMYTSMTTHEAEVVPYFEPKEGENVVDVGASFGRYTLLASKKVGPNGKVLSIEPEYENFRLLNRNIALNKLYNVTTLQLAAYSKKEKLRLYSNYTIMPELAGRYNQEFVQVNGNTLDNILNQIGLTKVNWMKIDVDGAELEVLKGSSNTLSKKEDLMLLIETHGEHLHHEVIQILDSFNFMVQFERSYDSETKHILCKKRI